MNLKKNCQIKIKFCLQFGIALTAVIAGIVLLYIFNKDTRDWINIHVLRKEITEEDVATIELDVDKQEYIYAYDRFICILSEGKLDVYNSYGGKEAGLDIQISNPIYSAANSYLGVAETNGQKVCLISERKSALGKQGRRKYNKNKRK